MWIPHQERLPVASISQAAWPFPLFCNNPLWWGKKKKKENGNRILSQCWKHYALFVNEWIKIMPVKNKTTLWNLTLYCNVQAKWKPPFSEDCFRKLLKIYKRLFFLCIYMSYYCIPWEKKIPGMQKIINIITSLLIKADIWPHQPPEQHDICSWTNKRSTRTMHYISAWSHDHINSVLLVVHS